MRIALTTDFILAILRCNLAFCSNISLSCICCCSRLISWFLLYRSDAALFWRMARWALCCFFCLAGNFEFLEGRGGREQGVSRLGRPFFGGILKGSAGKVLGIMLGRGLAGSKSRTQLYWRQLYWRAPACSTCSAVAAQVNGYTAVQYSRGGTEAASGGWQQEDCLTNICNKTTTKQS